VNIAGLGVDAVEVNRIKQAMERYGEGFLRKILTDREVRYASSKNFEAMHVAGKFAAKEAVKKALPDGAEIGLNWPDIEILNSDDGKPYVELHGRASGLKEHFNVSKVLVSISHTRGLATANALVVTDG
jgi:holo-[acyl-carrier protein] synthase